MWNSIANLKENLNRIALDVHGSDEEREIDDECEDPLVSDRRNSNGLAQSKPALRSPAGHAVMDYPFASEIEHYKAEIKRLQGSEAEIKALSVNYAALLKEKEDQISKLNEENGLLKQNLNAANSTLKASRSDGFGASTNNQNALMGDGKNSFNGNNFPNRLHKPTSQLKRSGGTQMNNGFVFKQDGLSNGSIDSVHPDAVESGIEKELTGMLEEKTRMLAAVQETCESQINQVRLQLEKEHNTSVNLQLKLQDELNLRESLQEELSALSQDKENACKEMEKINSELNLKLSEAKQLQMELHSKENVVADDAVENLKRVIAALEKDNANLKAEKGKQVAALMASRSFSTDEVSPDVSENHIKHQSSMNEKVHSPGSFPGQEELDLTVQKMDKGLKEAKQERDKALQELARLKQHLLDKESEESDKMDEDSKIIEELRSNNEQLRARISQMERALKQAIASQEEVKMNNTRELQMSKDTINGLNKKLASCLNTIDAKNVELLNLQTALGQYYAEIEAKEHLEEDFSLAREESARLSELLKNADQQLDVSKREKEEILLKLSQTEHTLAEAKTRTRKLEDDNAKLRQAVEQSMTRINRMSMDSDYFVDRRIVIKLLVTYFQRNHSKEVLELMVRMLGFSEEDKQRIGFAQQVAGKGVVRGVLGLPSRLVGGILGGSSSEAHSNTASENQSFADLWVDFLLKESEERGRKTVMDEQGGSSSPSPNPNTQAVLPSLQSVHSESEFSTVPLTSSESTRLFPR